MRHKKSRDFNMLCCYLPAMRLLLISIGSLVLALFILLTARMWGQGQSYPEYVHPFFGQIPFNILQVTTVTEAQNALIKYPQIVFQLPVRMSQDLILFVLDSQSEQKLILYLQNQQEQNPGQLILKSQKIYDYSWSEIKQYLNKLSINTEELKTFYKQFAEQKFILDVLDNTYDIDQELIKQLKAFQPDERTLLQSDIGTILSAVKMLKPEWLYGSSKADLVRMKTMQSMWILPALQFKGDVLIAPVKMQNRDFLNPDIISELRRRHKKIIVGPIQNEQELFLAKQYKPDAYLFLDARLISQ